MGEALLAPSAIVSPCYLKLSFSCKSTADDLFIPTECVFCTFEVRSSQKAW